MQGIFMLNICNFRGFMLLATMESIQSSDFIAYLKVKAIKFELFFSRPPLQEAVPSGA